MTKDKIKDKIGKLLSLSQSSNENEAAVALTRAMKLASKFNIDIDSVEKPSANDIIDNNLSGAEARLPVWKRQFATRLGNIFGCTVYWGPMNMKVNDRNKMGYGLGVVGFKQDIELVKYLYENLSKQAVRMSQDAWNNYTGPTPGKTYRNSFLLGFSTRVIEIANNLFKKESKQVQQEYGLVLKRKHAVDLFCKGRFRTARATSNNVCGSGFGQGYKAGNKASFSKGGVSGTGIKGKLN